VTSFGASFSFITAKKIWLKVSAFFSVLNQCSKTNFFVGLESFTYAPCPLSGVKNKTRLGD
jgi:hypothetical protein